MLFDLLVEQGLRDGGIVDFAVTVAAVTDKVDDDVRAEFIAIFRGDSSDTHDRVDIFGIDVEDRNRLPSGDAGGKARRVFFRVAGSETEKIVDNDVNRAADGIARKISVVHGLGENSLPRERGVPMDE